MEVFFVSLDPYAKPAQVALSVLCLSLEASVWLSFETVRSECALLCVSAASRCRSQSRKSVRPLQRSVGDDQHPALTGQCVCVWVLWEWETNKY